LERILLWPYEKIRPGATKKEREERVQLVSKRFFGPICVTVEELEKTEI
jgi:hypothetical protein